MLINLVQLDELTTITAATDSAYDIGTEGAIPKHDAVRVIRKIYSKRPWNQPDLTFTLKSVKDDADRNAGGDGGGGGSSRTRPERSKRHQKETARQSTEKKRTKKTMTREKLTKKKLTKKKRTRKTSLPLPSGRKQKLPLCTRDQVKQGEWVHVRLSQPPYVTPTVHLRCYPRDHYYGPHYDTWAWHPHASAAPVSVVTIAAANSHNAIDDGEEDDGDGDDGEEDDGDGDDDEEQEVDDTSTSCEFTEWQPDLFCSLLQSATIAIVGDSLSWENYASLVQLLGLKTKQGYQHQSLELGTNIQQSVCGGQTSVVYRRDDQLSKLPAVWQKQQQQASTATSSHYSFPTVLILNRGAHYVNDTMLLAGIRRNLNQVDEWMQECRVLQVDCHFFWRTSVPGHVGCDDDDDDKNKNHLDFSRPVNDVNAMEARIANRTLYSERQLKYHWYDYQHQNELVLRELERSGLDYTVLDAYHLNVLRPDEHRSHQEDCLHNCYPGKMDVYNQLLLHYLRQRVSESSVQRTRAVAREQEWRTDVTTVYNKKATMDARKRRLQQKKKA
jgi:hypothetical protein